MIIFAWSGRLNFRLTPTSSRPTARIAGESTIANGRETIDGGKGMTRIKKTLARRITIRSIDGKTELDLVLYLQPNGILVFRKFRGRKRYATRLEAAWDRAQNNGPCGADLYGPILGWSLAPEVLPKKPNPKRAA